MHHPCEQRGNAPNSNVEYRASLANEHIRSVPIQKYFKPPFSGFVLLNNFVNVWLLYCLYPCIKIGSHIVYLSTQKLGPLQRKFTEQNVYYPKYSLMEA